DRGEADASEGRDPALLLRRFGASLRGTVRALAPTRPTLLGDGLRLGAEHRRPRRLVVGDIGLGLWTPIKLLEGEGERCLLGLDLPGDHRARRLVDLL